ncbi:MAG: InlB B-repeat-containing protein, partial [Acholeplasmataceae bacterium]|nr:InlB B-repeat-containing protein [Acholeplasmataceae bacterium]
MKKLFFILSILMLATTLFSCLEGSNYTIDRVTDRVSVIFAEGDDVNSVTTHVTLPTKTDFNKSAVLSWTSDTPSILDEFGTVNRPDETTEVILTLKVTMNGETREKNVYLMVIGLYEYFFVAFEINEVTTSSIKVRDGDKVTPIASPTLSGHSFTGWFTVEDNENAFDFDTPITENIKLVAKFDVLVIASYKIEYYEQNITDDAYTLVTTDQLTGGAGVLVETSKEKFGFSIDLELSFLSGIIQADGSLILKVYYERNLYNITFISEGVELSASQYRFGAPLSPIADPQKDGHILVGWATTVTGTSPFVFPGTVSSNITFYAIWRLDDGYSYTGYYEGADGLTGIDLRTFLRIRVNTGTTMVNYGEARYVLDDTDRDPNNPNNLILVYLGTSVSGVWDDGSTWNREHVWPQSLLGVSAANSTINVASDLHNLKPANPAENTRRGNKFFDVSLTTVSYTPRDEVKGDVARILLHMDLAYANLN